MRSAVILAVALLGLVLPAAAQDDADKVRLDDFDLPAAPAGPRIEQLGDGTESLRRAPPLIADHELSIPGPPAADRSPVSQLTQPGESGRSQQLSERGESRELATGSVSSPGDSRPQASAPLGGSDRCDPQLETEKFESCLRVLEQRATEFDAPEAPRLSAEQVLLAERGYSDERLAATSSDMRLRLAAGNPNAERASNQELASIYLDPSRAQGRPGPEPDDPRLDEAKLAEVLQGLQIELPGSGAP